MAKKSKRVVSREEQDSELPAGRKIVLAIRDLRTIAKHKGDECEAGIIHAINLLGSITLGDLA